ncbi:T9SS type A sorting domain-containing protein [Flavobacterium salilacus subsp. salilacus]|uniref:endonuclease n=1 Tax=Flavobacterium TaxID=237 RepID=UPI0013C300D8|nr:MULTISPECIES: endonuclease [Flavobacterium]KAF2519325.1 T9SS type A sorting domain-containing protein [Flavobacterium salilacus subsp. salilacus]MBE1613516.1 endonuclease [Flavobacterium sp. SaA2.13]
MTKKKMTRILAFLLLPFYCLAQIPEYYSSVNFGLTGDDLKDELAVLISETHVNELDYTPDVWNALKAGDLDPENTENVLLIYGYNDNDEDPDNDRTRDKDESCHNTSGGCQGQWVREHVYPRSLGNPNLEYEGPGSDAHHLRPIDFYMNNSRSNKRFADGSGDAVVVSGGYFYPGDEWKGDIARMMMYMYVRYQSQCLAIVVGSGDTTHSEDMPDIFLEWNAEDPVSEYEMNRNNVLNDMQGNRNPFIDNPYLATIIWNGPNAENTWLLNSDSFLKTDLIVYPTVTTGTVYVDNADNHNYSYTLYNMVGQEVKSTSADNKIDLEGNQSGIYILNIVKNNKTKSFRILLK